MTHENAEDLTANVLVGRSVRHRSTIGFARHRSYGRTATVDKIAQPMGNLGRLPACPLSKVMRTCAPSTEGGCRHSRNQPLSANLPKSAIRSMFGFSKPELDPHPLPRNVTLALLLAPAAAAWAVLVWHHHDVNMDRASPAMGLHAAPFLAMWVVAMVAMMCSDRCARGPRFPEMQAAKRQPDDAFVSTWVFADGVFVGVGN